MPTSSASGYKREPDLVYVAPHRHSHAGSDILFSIAVQLDATGVSENVYGCFANFVQVDGAPQLVYRVQMMHNQFLPGDDPTTAFMLDRGVQATTCAVGSSSGFVLNTPWTVKFSGLIGLEGETVTAMIGGANWGQVTVSSNGEAIVPVSMTGPLNPYLLIQAFNWQDTLGETTLSAVVNDFGGPDPANPSGPGELPGIDDRDLGDNDDAGNRHF